MKRVALLAALAAVLSITAYGQSSPSQDATSGAGDPRLASPQPDCSKFKLYTDTITGNIYGASGAPCVWVPTSGAIPAGGRLTTPLSAVGSATQVTLYSVQIPAGTLKANSVVKIHARGDAPAGNTGSCILGWKLNTDATGGGTNIVYTATLGASSSADLNATLWMNNSTSAESMGGFELTTNNSTSANQPTTQTASINSATAVLFLNLVATPANSTDTCTANEADVEIYL